MIASARPGSDRETGAGGLRGFRDRRGAAAAAGRDGAAAKRQRIFVDAVKPKGVDRPWSPAMAGEGDAETNILAPRRREPRAVDATPLEADLAEE